MTGSAGASSQPAPHITIVIAAFNCGPWIQSTLQDVLAQTYRDFELIVVDDGSTDDTAAKVRAVADARIRYVKQPNSGGPAKPRNTGLALARGELIAFLDHDDRWRPARLEAVVRCFRDDPSIDVVCHDERVVRAGADVGVNRYGPASRSMYLDMILHGNRLSTSATTARTELIRRYGGFDERRDFLSAEDFDLWLRLARGDARFHFLHDVLGDFLLSDGSMTANLESHYKKKVAVYQTHLEISPELAPYRGRILGFNEYAFGRSLHSSGQFKGASQRYALALRCGYVKPKVIGALALSILRIRR